MASIDEIYKTHSKFLKAADLGNQKPVVEIESAEAVENTFEGETKTQIVLTFVGKEKVLGLNVTNARKIAQLLDTPDFSQWPGFKIRLYVDQTEFQGKPVACIRIFPDLPEQTNEKAKAATATTGNEEDIAW